MKTLQAIVNSEVQQVAMRSHRVTPDSLMAGIDGFVEELANMAKGSGINPDFIDNYKAEILWQCQQMTRYVADAQGRENHLLEAKIQAERQAARVYDEFIHLQTAFDAVHAELSDVLEDQPELMSESFKNGRQDALDSLANMLVDRLAIDFDVAMDWLLQAASDFGTEVDDTAAAAFAETLEDVAGE